MNWKNERGWIVLGDLRIPSGGGIKVEFLDDKSKEWLPARVFADISEDRLFSPANGEDETTNNYVGVGLIQENTIRNDQIFWNYHLDARRSGNIEAIMLKTTIFEAGGANVVKRLESIPVNTGGVLFLDDWKSWKGAGITTASKPLETRELAEENDLAGWVVDSSEVKMYQFLTIKKRQKVDPIYYYPNLSGDYDLYVMVDGFAEFRLELPGITYYEKIYLHQQNITYRTQKEIYIGTYSFGEKDRIGIHQAPAAVTNPDHAFGDLGYIKLVKSDKPVRPGVPLKDDNLEIAFYSEPLSIAYFGDLQNRKMAEALVQEYKALNVDRIFCQPGRCGSVMLYESEIAKPAYPELRNKHHGDDGQCSSGVAEMVENMDVIAELSHLCGREDIDFVISAGVNALCCYPRSRPAATLFGKEHPELAHPIYPYQFDYSLPKARDYFCSWMEELIQYPIKGISLDYCRWPSAFTSDVIVTLHREMKERLGDRWNNLEISARFPVNDPVFYQGLEAWLKEDLIDLIIPANPFSCYPQMNLSPYVSLARSYGKKVYADINNLSKRYQKTINVIRPNEVRAFSNTYRAAGVDGLFFYQSEMIIDNIFLRRTVRDLKENNAFQTTMEECFCRN